ncbi:hypothetical protein TNCV_139731 [Trichonephila clavipes]|uniref:Uncharacterized protein n=1 Tax=Trichonephila clavipes TaxID=2585209 RepID=A0A8X6V4P1_TRICX|nr:hypothetical protein TNCV_139731 [Trichonephila clavipes]
MLIEEWALIPQEILHELDLSMRRRLNKSDCEETEESADVIDNISVNIDTYVARDGTEWISHNSNCPCTVATRNVLPQWSDSRNILPPSDF